MPVTQAQLDMVANAALDFYFNKGEAFQQSLQERPLVRIMEAGAKNFPGGKGSIDLAIMGEYGDGSGDDVVKGYEYDDQVDFYNPTNLARVKFPWKEHHIGISVTHTELKNDGVSVSDEMGNTSQHTGRDQTMLINIWESKLFQFGEQYARGMNGLYWGDGTGDAKAIAGMQAILVADPSVGTIGGMDRSVAANWYFRNRARTAVFGTKVGATPALAKHGGGAVTSSPNNGGVLWQTLQAEMRQLRRYGGRPNRFLAGSDFIGALEVEMRANGYYSQSGFKKAGDGAMGPMLFDGTTVEYDPTLDDLGFAKRGYWWDDRHIKLMKMTGEWRRIHKPARPHDRFVLYRSITSTGSIVAQQVNSGLVIDIT